MNPLLPDWLNELVSENEKLRDENQKLRDENQKLKLAPSSEGIEFCKDLLEQFDDGDILECASECSGFQEFVQECSGFQDIVEESEFYIELQEELDELKEELAEAKLAPSSEGIEFCKEVLEQFDDGDILECASECYGFQDIVEQSEFYIELKEELALVHTSTSRLLDEMKKELDEMKGANEDLVEQIGGVENDCEDRIEELKTAHEKEIRDEAEKWDAHMLDWVNEVKKDCEDRIEKLEKEMDELEKLKNVCRLEDGRPFTIEGDRFNSGDIFEYAADCHGFQEFVEATPFFEEMNEERDTLQGIVDDHRFSEEVGLPVLLMKVIEKLKTERRELKTELRESQVDNVVNELVIQVCEGV